MVLPTHARNWSSTATALLLPTPGNVVVTLQVSPPLVDLMTAPFCPTA